MGISIPKILIVCLFFLFACSHSDVELAEKAKMVKLLTTPEEYPQCVFLDELKAVSLTGLKSSYQKAWIKIRNAVAYRGGTHLKILLSETSKLSTTIVGEAYKCPVNIAGEIRNIPINIKDRLISKEID